VVAACDVDAAKAGAFAEKHGIPRHFGDLDMLFRECAVDAVTNVTPDRFHAPVSIHALHAGKHVLCEKPLAMNYKEAMDMVETAESRGLINMVNLTYRNSAALQKARELVSAGDLGEIVHCKAGWSRRPGGIGAPIQRGSGGSRRRTGARACWGIWGFTRSISHRSPWGGSRR
jgi:predicted dehydrogenase